ncbi:MULTISPECIES: restriction endonuclease subunit S [Streptococcus]|uniref:Type IC specificity subunit n=1 Tax=Streptococcus pseudopneumoniae TaxID=257758 RepID=A0A2P0A2S9_9STRE|nr:MULTISPECIES: restriction endonuclease subunit S [Streptococcus]CEY66905.1 type IC specificity subunit [Streptococcus pseudopneumoniae]CIP53440.1 type IC specificity subunit [Streptococcus pseudopneumoniae]
MTKKPSYRFVGYTESWEEKKFQELSTKKGKKNTNGESYPVYSVSNQSGLIPQSEQFEGSRLDNLDKKSYKIVEPNEFAYNPARINVGSIAFNNLNHRVIVSSLYVIFILDKKVDNSFAIQFIKSDKFIKEVKRNTEGSVREYLFYENFSNIRLPYPPSLPEQTAIGSFFQDIDQLISLQQRKLEVLKEQKKTYLKLLFPAKGQTKPALRFAGFEDDWKEVKLGEVGETYTGLSGKTKEDFGHGEGKFITYVNVFNNPLTDLYGLDSIEIDDKQRRVQYGDVLFTTSSETPEDVGLSSVWMGTEDNVYLNSFCFGYRLQKGIFDLYYLAFVLRSFSVRREFMLLAQGISRFNISKTKVMDMFIHIPSLPEQEAIGSFFQDLDKAIAKQEEKVNQLKESKQTLLRKMFI